MQNERGVHNALPKYQCFYVGAAQYRRVHLRAFRTASVDSRGVEGIAAGIVRDGLGAIMNSNRATRHAACTCE